ncbi:MAG: radical SAM protein [Candidatus Methanoperedens sp.]
MRKESFGFLIYDVNIDRFYFLHQKDLKNELDINESRQRIIDYLINYIKYNIECGKYDFENSNFYLRKPCTVTWEITNKCNLDCCYCFSKNSSSLESNYELTNHIIDNIKNAEVMRVNITGGEPLINLEGLFYILKNLSNNKMGIVLSTNGTMIDRNLAIKISKYVTAVQISLDGTQETHDTIKGRDAFNKTIEGINYCIKNGIYTQVNLIPTKLNKEEIIETISLCEELGVKRFHLFPLVPRGKGSKVYETLKLEKMEIENIYNDCQKTKEKKGWNIGISLSRRHLSQGSCILIKPNGLVQSPSYDSNESFDVGELDDFSLLKIWDESKIFSKKNHLIQTNPYLIIRKIQ